MNGDRVLGYSGYLKVFRLSSSGFVKFDSCDDMSNL